MAASSLTPVRHQVLRVISQRKHIHRRLFLASELEHDLHVDPVDIILALEQQSRLTIPDEVPLRVVGDFVHYVATHQPTAPAQVARFCHDSVPPRFFCGHAASL